MPYEKCTLKYILAYTIYNIFAFGNQLKTYKHIDKLKKQDINIQFPQHHISGNLYDNIAPLCISFKILKPKVTGVLKWRNAFRCIGRGCNEAIGNSEPRGFNLVSLHMQAHTDVNY